MKANDIRKMSAEELENQLKELKGELFNLRFQHAINQQSAPGIWKAICKHAPQS